MYRYIFWCFWAVCFLLGGCSSAGGDTQPEGVQSLLEKAGNDVAAQRFEPAMEKALQALELSEGNPSLKVQALSTIVGIDIMTNRDEDAWKKALEAEDLARKHELRKELSAILISKAKLCSYAEGLSAAQIAERLFLSVHTVNTHRQRIYAKLDVRNVSDMIRKTTDLGIL